MRWPLALVLMFAALVGHAGSASAVDLPEGFRATTVWTGVGLPTVIRFAPDGRVLVANKRGVIYVYDSLEDRTPTEFADLSEKVHDYWDRGLLGMALDPASADVYVLYPYDKAPDSDLQPRWGDTCPSPPGPTEDGCVVSGRLSRLAPDGSETVLIEDWCQQFPSHSVGWLEFGPDGQLYASAGDGASFLWGDYGQNGNPCGDPPGKVLDAATSLGGSLRSQSFRRMPGLDVSLNGSIVRVDPRTGDASADNPAAGDPDENRRRIIAYGLRNPFRFTFRPGTRELWVGEVGADFVEEINRVEDRPEVPNFGWPCFDGEHRHWSFGTLGNAACESLYAEGGARSSYFLYDHDQPVVPGDGCPVGQGSVSGVAFYTGAAFPARYSDALFFSDYTRGCIWVAYEGADGLPDMGTLEPFATGAEFPVTLTQGPDGALYYGDLKRGSIVRIEAHVNRPTARLTATPTEGIVPLEVRFDASASSDPEGRALIYEWDLDGDGAYDDSTEAAPSRTYTTPGNVTAGVRVTDATGQTDTASQTITVGAPPTVKITAPDAWTVGEEVQFSGVAYDSSGAELPASALTWSLAIRHCARTDASQCHTHPVQTYTDTASAAFVAPDHEYPSHLELSLTARDAAGLTTTRVARLDPRTVDLTMTSDPPGLAVVLGDERAVTPFTRTVLARSRNSVGAAASQALGDGTYTFAGWSDGVSPTGTLTAPASGAATYTARFTRPPRSSLAGAEVVGAHVATAAPGHGAIYAMTAAATHTAHSLRLFLDGASTASRVVLGLYADADGRPGTLLASGTVAAPAADAWNTAWLDAGVPIEAARTYWLAVHHPPASAGVLAWRDRAAAAGPGEVAAVALPALPASWLPPVSGTDGHVSGGVWADREPEPEPEPTPEPEPQPTPEPEPETTPEPELTPTPTPEPCAPPAVRSASGECTGVAPCAAPCGAPPGIVAPPDLGGFPAEPRLLGAWGFDDRAGRDCVAGRHGKAFRMDRRHHLSMRPPQLTALTLEAWVYVTRAGWIARRGSAFGLSSTGVHVGARSARASVPKRRWTHVAMTYDGASLRVYRNGRLAGSTRHTGGIPRAGQALRFEGFTGRLDDVRLYDGALTAAQVARDLRAAVR
ncbi:PQQ-dependent sugar dehydrogenase [Solirubrobacter sp. CPCC 204708]|nr:PQQ-dependent sugar dehydrogenase [Solirubrobacter deserti]